MSRFKSSLVAAVALLFCLPFVVVSQATWRVTVAKRIKGLRGGRTPFYEITLSEG